MKLRIRNIVQQIAILIKFSYLKLFTKNKKVDKTDPKTFPIIIISFNQLFYLKQLISTLQDWNYKNIVIIDNASTYKPLIDYFDEIKKQVSIHRLKNNYGHLVFWRRRDLFMLYGKNYYVLTDADIVPSKKCPADFLKYFKSILDKNNNISKVGFSLKINDIPDSNPNKAKILKWEQKFWNDPDMDGNYIADIDTTFALYRGGNLEIDKEIFYKGIRTKPPYTALHGGWYLDVNTLSVEQINYMKTANNSSSWRISEEGKLTNSQY